MSKKTKTRAKQERAMQKASRKAQMKAQYSAWAMEGLNKKTDRAMRRVSGSPVVKDVKHPDGPCGNVGCLKCHPWAAPRPTSRLSPRAG